VRPDVHLAPGCPWWGLSELRLPNVDWCEMQRCSWVVEPANTWSNLSYALVGVAMYLAARRSPSPHLRFFAPAALLVGLASGIYHASYTFVLQILDFAGMYGFCALLLTLNLRRAGLLGAHDWRKRFWQGVIAATGVTVAVDFTGVPIQSLVFVLILGIVGSEVLLIRRAPGTKSHLLVVAVALLGAGAVFSLLDVTRTWCLPSHAFLQGHAIWHVLSALSLLACFFHYRQFEDQLGA